MRPTSATIREHLLNIHTNGDAAEHERNFPLRPQVSRRSKKSPDDSHVSALIQVHEGFIKLDNTQQEGYKCASCLHKMKISQVDDNNKDNNKDTGNMMTWPRRQTAKAKLRLSHKQSSCDDELEDYSQPQDARSLDALDGQQDQIEISVGEICIICNCPAGDPFQNDDSIRTPPDTLGSSEASLMSTSSGVFVDALSAPIAPPPTPATPVNGTERVLGMTNSNLPKKKLTASQSSIEALEVIADSVAATADVIQMRKSRDTSLHGTSTTSESLQSDLLSEDIEDETDRMLEAHFEMDIPSTEAEDVFCNGGGTTFSIRRKSTEPDYAELDENPLPLPLDLVDDPNYQTLPTPPETTKMIPVEGDYDEPPDDFFSAEEDEIEVKGVDGTMIAIRLSHAPPPPPPLHKMPSWVSILYWTMSSNKTTIRNQEQGSFCFRMQKQCQMNSSLVLYCLLSSYLWRMPYIACLMLNITSSVCFETTDPL